MSESIQAFRLGATVIVGGDVAATVLQVAISFRGVQYQVSWWDGRTRRAEWVDACEVTCADDKQGRVFIGFLDGISG